MAAPARCVDEHCSVARELCAAVWRVASFFGLGLTLLGIGFLFQRYVFPRRAPQETSAG
jgi:uncharacterized membrane protein